jgi:uncharacterized protein
MALRTFTRRRALVWSLTPVVAGLVVACASAQTDHRTARASIWAGTYTLPPAAQPVAITISMRGTKGVVSLGPGHAAGVQVAIADRRGVVRFAVPGRPDSLRFVGRTRHNTAVGSVRQGAARGSFRLHAVQGAPLNSALGIYALDAGGAVGLFDYSRLGVPAWEVDYTTGAFHALRGNGSALAAGPALLTKAPSIAQIVVAGDRLTWTPNLGPPVTGKRLAVSQYEVRFPSGKAMLAGTLSIPATPGGHPAVALVHGSGPALRDEGQFSAGLMLQHGIAVLSYDKRGVGQSTGRYPGESATDTNIDVYARDAEAAIRFLGRQPGIDPSRLGLFGGSQAGWIIPLAAARSTQVQFAIIESGPTVTVGETADFSNYTTQGASELTQPLAQIEAQVRRDGTSGFDPQPWIRKLTIPILWLFGGLDMNQPSNLDIQALENLKRETGHDYSWRLYPHGNHGIFVVETGLNSELTSSPGMPAAFFSDVADWLRLHGLSNG